MVIVSVWHDGRAYYYKGEGWWSPRRHEALAMTPDEAAVVADKHSANTLPV